MSGNFFMSPDYYQDVFNILADVLPGRGDRNEKKALSIIIGLLLIAAGASILAACGQQNQESETANSAVKTVIGNMKTYCAMNDGTWMCDGVIYKYRLEIKGRMPNAAADSTFVYLSNIEEISFERANKAAGVSSNSADYFSPAEAVLVEMK